MSSKIGKKIKIFLNMLNLVKKWAFDLKRVARQKRMETLNSKTTS